MEWTACSITLVLAGDAFLKICQPNLELLTERGHLEMAESLMRVGISSIYNERLFTANNKFLPNFNPNQPESFAFFDDANNLYGGVMMK